MAVIGGGVVVGQAQIAVAEGQPIEAYGIIARVEIGRYGFARVEDFYLFGRQEPMGVTIHGVEHVVGRIGIGHNFNIEMPCEDARADEPLLVEVVPEVYECNFYFLHLILKYCLLQDFESRKTFVAGFDEDAGIVHATVHVQFHAARSLEERLRAGLVEDAVDEVIALGHVLG